MSKEKQVSVGVVQVGGGETGGGASPGSESRAKDIENLPASNDKSELNPASLGQINGRPASRNPGDLENLQAPGATQTIEAGKQAIQKLESVSKDAGYKTVVGLRGKGGMGTSKGGGKDKGDGPDSGNGRAGTLAPSQPRALRWTLLFDTRSGSDYADQLQALGAILAIPGQKEPPEYTLIEDLKKRPVRAEAKDLAQIKRIYWIDRQPESVTGLVRALGLQPVPSHIVAFFPAQLEEKLLQLELKYRGKREEEIHETRFRIVRSGTGYEPRVESQE